MYFSGLEKSQVSNVYWEFPKIAPGARDCWGRWACAREDIWLPIVGRFYWLKAYLGIKLSLGCCCCCIKLTPAGNKLDILSSAAFPANTYSGTAATSLLLLFLVFFFDLWTGSTGFFGGDSLVFEVKYLCVMGETDCNFEILLDLLRGWPSLFILFELWKN